MPSKDYLSLMPIDPSNLVGPLQAIASQMGGTLPEKKERITQQDLTSWANSVLDSIAANCYTLNTSNFLKTLKQCVPENSRNSRNIKILILAESLKLLSKEGYSLININIHAYFLCLSLEDIAKDSEDPNCAREIFAKTKERFAPSGIIEIPTKYGVNVAKKWPC